MKYRTNNAPEKTECISVFAADKATLKAVAGARGLVPAVVAHEALAHWMSTQPEHIRAVAAAAATERKLSAWSALNQPADR